MPAGCRTTVGRVDVNDLLVIGLMVILVVSTLAWVPGLSRLMRS
jgi:hypothetical protein